MIIQDYKGYNICHEPLTKYHLQTQGRGSLPTQLKGSFNSVKVAMNHIDTYLRLKENKNAKAED